MGELGRRYTLGSEDTAIGGIYSVVLGNFLFQHIFSGGKIGQKGKLVFYGHNFPLVVNFLDREID